MLRTIILKPKALAIILLGVFIYAAVPAYAVTQGYLSDDNGLQPGMVVQLSQNSDADNPTVERASSDQAERIIGVTTTIEESSVTIASALQTVYVEASGEVSTYVSDINGQVKQGDLLTISPLNGVLAKHIATSPAVFGLAIEDAASQSSETYTVQTPEGEKTTAISKIKVNIDQKGLEDAHKEPSALEKLGQSITNKEISELRVVVGLIIFIVVLVTEGAILYGSISSAVTSIGRNPLANKYIKKELLKVIGVAFIVMIVGLASLYFLLWV